jgi:hypothetical protein
MVGGTVTLSLADIDKLRNELKDANAALKAKEAELAEVKADKRTVLIERVKPLEKSHLRLTMPEYRIRELMESMKSRNPHHDGVFITEHSGRYMYDRYGEMTVNRYVDVHIDDNKTEEKTSYTNFEDVKDELRKQIEGNYIDEVSKLKAEARTYSESLAHAKEDFRCKSINLQKKFEEERKKYEEELRDWAKRYEELETGKKELSRIEELEKELEELMKKFDEEKSKKWYQKF